MKTLEFIKLNIRRAGLTARRFSSRMQFPLPVLRQP